MAISLRNLPTMRPIANIGPTGHARDAIDVYAVIFRGRTPPRFPPGDPTMCDGMGPEYARRPGFSAAPD